MPTLANQFQFVDRSFVGPLQWAWDFGDGVGTATQENPSYTFPSAGPALYLVRLSSSALACGGGPAGSTVWRPVAVRNISPLSSVIVSGVTYFGNLRWFGFYPYV